MNRVLRRLQTTAFSISVCFFSCLPGSAAPVDPFGLQDSLNQQVSPSPSISESFSGEQRLRLNAARSAFEAGDFETAEGMAREITSRLPDAPEGWHLLGMSLGYLERYEESIEALNKAGQLYKFNGEPYRLAANVYVKLGRFEEARESYEAALRTDPENWLASESLGLLFEQTGDLAGAGDAFRQAMEAAPEDEIRPRIRLALNEIRTGETETGIARLLGALKERPDLHEMRKAVVELLVVSNRTGDAADLLAGAAEADPENSAAVLMAARAELAALRIEAATERLHAARQSFGDDPVALYAIGTMLGAARDYTKSAEAFTAGLELAPNDPALLRGLRNAQFRAGEMAEARVAAEALSTRDDATSMDALWLGFIAEGEGDVEAAEAAYRTAMKRDEGNWGAANNLAALLVETKPAEAIEVALRAVEVSENAKQARVTLGLAYLEAGNAPEAVAVFAPLAEAPDASARTIYRHGLALLKGGTEDAGREEIERALETDPEFEDAAQARAILGRN